MIYNPNRWYELFRIFCEQWPGAIDAAGKATDEAYRYTEARRLYPELPIDEAMTAYLTRSA